MNKFPNDRLNTSHYEAGTLPKNSIRAPCGNIAILDRESSIGAYICQTCLTVVGSISNPCRNLEKDDDNESE